MPRDRAERLLWRLIRLPLFAALLLLWIAWSQYQDELGSAKSDGRRYVAAFLGTTRGPRAKDDGAMASITNGYDGRWLTVNGVERMHWRFDGKILPGPGAAMLADPDTLARLQSGEPAVAVEPALAG